MISKLEKNTDFLLQEFWKNIFNTKFSFDKFPALFDTKIPDGIQFINDGIIIIENKKDISLYNKGIKQLTEYVSIIHEKYQDMKIYGVLGFGTDELIVLFYEFNFNESSISYKQINDINIIKQLHFITPEEWLIKYHLKQESYVIRINDDNKDEIEKLLKNKYNITLQKLNQESDTNDIEKITSNNNLIHFIRAFLNKSNKLISLNHIYKLANEFNYKANTENNEENIIFKIIPSSQVSIRISNEYILNELIKIFNNNMYIFNKEYEYKNESIEELLKDKIISKCEKISNDELDRIYVLY